MRLVRPLLDRRAFRHMDRRPAFRRFHSLGLQGDLAIAALLHDSVEDQGGNVRNRFGDRVARVVAACSDSLADTAQGERKADWQKRKEAYLSHLDTAEEDVLRVSLADKRAAPTRMFSTSIM